MTKTTAIERINKAEETITKKQGTIIRYEKTLAKKTAELKKLGADYDKLPTDHWVTVDELERMGLNHEDAWKAYWVKCDIGHIYEGIANANKAIKETIEKLEGYRTALEEAEQREKIIANDIPERMKEAKEELVREWTLFDIRRRDYLQEAYKELGCTAFVKKFKYSAYQDLWISDEDIKKQNEKEATAWLLDLYNRVKKITGNITDCANLHWGGKALNGYIVGEKGSADVFTIEAGGYNIQRWHLRVLVKER